MHSCFILLVNQLNNHAHRQINPQTVHSITFHEHGNITRNSNYILYKMDQLTTTNKELIYFFTESLNDNYRTNIGHKHNLSGPTPFHVTFHIEGRRDVTRSITIKDITVLIDLLLDYDPFKTMITASLVDFKFNHLTYRDRHTLNIEIDHHEIQALGELFMEELQTVGVEAFLFLYLHTSFSFFDYLDYHEELSGFLVHHEQADNRHFSRALPISNLTPKTQDMFLALIK